MTVRAASVRGDGVRRSRVTSWDCQGRQVGTRAIDHDGWLHLEAMPGGMLEIGAAGGGESGEACPGRGSNPHGNNPTAF